jgi:Do/DeqQ family serine protease
MKNFDRRPATHRWTHPGLVSVVILMSVGGLLGAILHAVVAGPSPSVSIGADPQSGTETISLATDPSADSSRSTRSGAPSDGGYADVVRGVLPAVVNISSVQVIRTYEHISPFGADPFFRRFFGDDFYDFVIPRERRSLSLGSGVVVDARGTLLTNYHVVEHASEVRVTLADGSERNARLLGADARTDLAVLRVDGDAPTSAPMGNSDGLEVGDVVLAIGNPFGIGQTVTMGIVSAIGRGNIGVADYEDFIQTDAAINPGNSGGALVNTRGEVIGISTAILSRSGGYQGIGFAIPSNMARDVLDSILEHGQVIRGYAGLNVQRLHPDIVRAFGLDSARGALVAALDPVGPAARAGLRRGDVIISAGGRRVESADDLRSRLSRLKPGDTVPIEVIRRGRRLDLELVLGEPPTSRSRRRR